eukprot:15469143-Alexandrium_andersonii.AAC.1
MLYQPEHYRMVGRDLPLDPLLQSQHQGADQPRELPHRVLCGTVGPQPTRGRRLERSLRTQSLSDRPAQVDRRGLAVGLEQ